MTNSAMPLSPTASTHSTSHFTQKILIGSSYESLRESFKDLIATCDGFELVGVTDIFEDKDDEDKQDEKKGILSMLANLQPDIALLGPFKPGRAWEAEILAYTKDHIRVIFVSGHAEPALYDAIALGAVGYLTPEASKQEVHEILEAAALGRSRFSGEVQHALANEIRLRDRTVRPVLTQKEQEVLRLMGQGLNSTEIGERLDIRKSTVKTHQYSLFRKLDVHNGRHAVVVGARHRLI